MSERQRKLTITERLILTYIGYKTNRNFKFFMTNETLAKAICCKTSSTKVMVNKLVREGYLIKPMMIRTEDNYRSPDANLHP